MLAAQTPGTGVIAGRVMAGGDTGNATPARGATVLLVGTALRATTDTDGRFLLGGVPAGPVILRARLLGYRAADRAIQLLPGDTARVDFILQPEARVLSPVRVEASLSRPNVTTIAVDAAAMTSIPTVGERDVVRVAQLLPGVVARNDFRSLYEAMGEFMNEHRKSGVLVDTAGLRPTAEATRIRSSRGKLSVTDGPFTETKEIVGGYALIDVRVRGPRNRVGAVA